jgi:hypothetical protein
MKLWKKISLMEEKWVSKYRRHFEPQIDMTRKGITPCNITVTMPTVWIKKKEY